MLVIRRKREQMIRIGDDIEITVLEIENGQVKLGINAPRQIPVFREEIAVTRRSNQGAALSLTGLSLAGLQTLENYAVPNSSSAPKVSISDAPT